MDTNEFKKLVKELDEACNATLLDRAEAYAGEDRLENFKKIAEITGIHPTMVAFVLHAKHIVALGKALRIRRYERTTDYIIDIINYQRLLFALIREEIDMNAPKPILGSAEGYIHTLKRPEPNQASQ